MQDVFVGCLCGIALFLFFYTGYDTTDNYLSHAAGIYALGVAWFPTSESGEFNLTSTIHYLSATSLFLILSYFCLFQFTKTNTEDPTPEKLQRNCVYRICGVMILASIVAMAIHFLIIPEGLRIGSFIFWGETIALIFFGISWLIKGEALLADVSTERQPQ